MHVHVQRLVSVVKMVTLLEGYATEEQRSVVHFFFVCGQKDSLQRIFIKTYLQTLPRMSYCTYYLSIKMFSYHLDLRFCRKCDSNW
jgi:hypothetical protein